MRNLILALVLMLGACSSYNAWHKAVERNEHANTIYPQNYKTEILSLLRTYLNDPSRVRDAFISEPAIKTIDGGDRYAACVRYNAKKSGGQYAGSKDAIVTFREGRLDRIIDIPREAREQCKDAAYKPFAELERLSR
jgi:hypothetical protein